MLKYVLANGNTDREMLYKTFESVKKQGIKCLTLDPRDPNSLKRIELFRIPVKKLREFPQDREEIHSLALSFMPATESTNACYTVDFLIRTNGIDVPTNPARMGCYNSIQLVKQFLDKMTMGNGGVLNKLKQSKPNEKTLNADNINYYINVLKNELRVRHAGAEPDAKWKYSLDEQEVAQVQEAFRVLFRDKVSLPQLNIEESFSIRAQYQAGNTSVSDTNNKVEEAPSF